MDRRAFMAATATLPLAATVEAAHPQTGATVDAPVADPHPEWLARWKAAMAAWEKTEEDTPEANALSKESERLSLLLCQTEATTIEGVRAQLEWIKEDLGDYISGMVGAPYDNALGVLQAGVSRMAGAV